jgi:twitching motility protein PilT
MLSLHTLLLESVREGASDLHLTVAAPPTVRVDGLMRPLSGYPSLTAEQVEELCFTVLSPEQRERFERTQELDMSIGVKGLCRFRVNVFVQKEAVAGVFRVIPSVVRTVEELGLPRVISDLARRANGLVLVTGPTGSGKSTTLAAMVDQVNRERACHIVTLEDPIEYVHTHKRALVNQREIGVDTHSFKDALRAVLRQDPDVVLVGEMRDLETVESALRISETGHLCFATLHTQSAMQSITRIIDMFPPHLREQIRVQLSFSLQGVLSQRLIPRADGRGRVLALELIVLNQAIRNLIREDKLHQIQSMVQMGQGKSGMVTMNQSLMRLYQAKLISLEDARANSNDLDEFTNMLVSLQGQGATPARPR